MTQLVHSDNGAALPVCGFETGRTVMLLASHPGQVNCPLCHLMIERVPVVPGKDLSMRHPHPPYVPADYQYVAPRADGLYSPMEFAREYRAPTRRVRTLILVMTGALLALLMLAGLAALATGAGADPVDPGEPSRPPASAPPPITYPRPPVSDD